MKKFIGLDIGGTKCAVVLASVDRGIHILDKLRFASLAERGCEDMLGRIFEAVDEVLERNGMKSADVEAIGVSCGGPLDSRRGLVLAPPNLPGWVNVPLVERLEKRFGVRAFLQNDANACALVEWKLGAGRGAENTIFLTMGTGMGGGVIAEGRLMRGASDMGGEIGHLRLAEDGPVGFGKAGSFEGFTSGGGIGRQAQALTRKLMEEGRTPQWMLDGHAIEEVDAKLMADYAHAGNAEARAFYASIGRMLGRGVSLLVDAFNPEVVVIGSIFVRAEDLLRPAMEEEMRRECIPYSLRAVQVRPAETGEAIGDLASVMTALYALNIDPMYEAEETDPRVLARYERLFEKYPALEGIRAQVMDAYRMLRDCYMGGGKLLLCGNGGSCADCEHIVGELMKGFWLKRPRREGGACAHLQGALPAIALTGHAALSSAFNNDVDPEYVYAQQAAGYGRPGDVLLGISTSGNAKNVFHAVEAAKQLGLKTLGLAGGSGGKLKEACDACVVVPGNCPADVQEYHLPVYHALCGMLEAKFFEE